MQDSQPQDQNFLLVEALTPREFEVLALLAERATNSEIAGRLSLALSTVKGYTREIYGKLGVNSRQAAVERAQQLGLLGQAGPSQRRADNLPADLTPFVGREREIEQIVSLFHDPACRVVTLFGPGGMGKTRLALQVARSLVTQTTEFFPNGVFFVPLFSLSTAAFIPQAVSSALELELDEADDSQKQLFQFLKKKSMLLVFDNMEHLWDEESAGFLGEILSSAPGVKLLITSRERLNLQGEQSFSLPGLDVPAEKQLHTWADARSEAAKFSSIRLFLQSARRANPAFQLAPKQVPAVVQICQLLGGMPLGIEMAAAWVSVLHPVDILAEIRCKLDFLEAETFAVPERQQRITVVLESSWKRLTEEEQTVAKALSVFRGSFDLSAARRVYLFHPGLLRSLVNKSWLQPIVNDRFQMHALLNQYACEQLAAEPELRRLFMDRHSQFFCEFLESRDMDWSGPRQSTVIAEIKREIDNIRAAWDWAVVQRRVHLLARGRYSLETFFEWTGLHREAEAAFHKANSCLLQLSTLESSNDPEVLITLAYLLTSQSRFSAGSAVGIQLLDHCGPILERAELQGADIRAVRARVLELYGLHWSLSDRKQARGYFEQSYAIYHEINDLTSMSRMLNNLGWVTWVTGDFQRSRQLNQQNLQMQQLRGDLRGVGNTLNMLGFVAKHLGELDEAERLQREGVACMRRAAAEKDVARLLMDFSATLIWNGKFDEALQTCAESRKIYENSGLVAERYDQMLGSIILHLGHYTQAEELALQEMAAAQAEGRRQHYGIARLHAGVAALCLGKPEIARHHLLESHTVLDSLQQNNTMMPKIELGFVERAQGNLPAAWKCLQESFPSVLALRSFLMLLHSLPLIALLLLDQDEPEEAVKLYALAWRYPYVRDSVRYQDLIAKELNRVAAKLGEERLAEFQAAGQALDLWQTAERLQVKLPQWAAKSTYH